MKNIITMTDVIIALVTAIIFITIYHVLLSIFNFGDTYWACIIYVLITIPAYIKLQNDVKKFITRKVKS